MRKFITVFVVALIAVGATLVSNSSKGAADEKKATKKTKYTLEQVMKDGMKKGLLKQVASGKASQAEKVKLLDMFISLYESEPHKGGKESWNNLAGNALAAAAKMVVDPKASPEPLKKATNCKACHSKHK